MAHGCRDRVCLSVSFVVMRRLGVAEAFTNHQHFSVAGFTVLF